MEQLKTAWGWLKANYFWLVCALLGIVVLVFSYTSANRLREQRTAGENNIKSAVTTVKNVENTRADIADESVKVHPNQSTIDGMQVEVDDALKVAAQAWKIRRATQDGLYKWPDVLGTHKKTFERLPWPEFIPPPVYSRSGSKSSTPEPTKDLELPGISAQVLEVYGREIRRVMPALAGIIGADWKYATSDSTASTPANTESTADREAGQPAADSPPPSAGDGGTKTSGSQKPKSRGGVQVKKYVVQWNPKDQDRWYEMVTSFRTISIEARPTLIGAVYIQENLWLLESLFRVIKAVNGEADANDIAAIKSIDHIYFGRDAQGLSGELSPVNSRLFLEARAGKAERSLKPPAATAKPPEKPKEGASENRFDPADQRFVDDGYQPIDAKTVREAVQADKLGKSAALTVAKRIPFRIGLTMDERKIPAFLAACANSPFRFETRQVRINRHESSLKHGTEDKQADMLQKAASELGMSGGGLGAAASNTTASVSASTRTNHEVRVEFYGFIKMYNPVNYKLLETEPEPSATDTSSGAGNDPGTAAVAEPAVAGDPGVQPPAPDNTPPPAEDSTTGDESDAAPVNETTEDQ